jgi:hypothetical protein
MSKKSTVLEVKNGVHSSTSKNSDLEILFIKNGKEYWGKDGVVAFARPIKE